MGRRRDHDERDVNERAAVRPARREMAAAAALGMVFAAVLIAATSKGRVADMTLGDGVLYRYVAQNLNAPRSQVLHDLDRHGTVIRYGRIGLPALLWVASAGRDRAMPYAQPALMVLAAGAIAAGARVLVPHRSPLFALAPFAAFGLTLSLTGGFAEPVAVAFALWAVVAARDGRALPAAALLAAALLTRENAAGFALGLFMWALLRGKRRRAVQLALCVVPVAAWHVFVGVRYGTMPLADPWLRIQVDNVGVPIAALVRALTRSPPGAVVALALHLLAWIGAVAWARRNRMALIAAVSGIALLVTGSYPWRFIGDGLRLQAFLEVAIVMSLASAVSPRSPAIAS
jgi:hypothetical protein